MARGITMLDIHLHWLAGFQEAVRRKSLSQAAEHLNITQPALSKQIQKLEHVLGVPLLVRTSSGVETTEAGAMLHERLHPLLADLQALHHDLLALNPNGPHKKIRLGSLPSLAAHLLPPVVLDLQKRQTEVEVTVGQTSEELMADLKNGRLDAALLAIEDPPPGWVVAELFRERLHAILPAAHPLADENTLSLADLAQEKWVMYPPACGIRQRVGAILQERGETLQVVQEVAFGDHLPSYVVAGAGLAVLPDTAAVHAVRREIAVVPLADEGLQRRIVLLARGSKLPEELLAALVQTISDKQAKA
jgi:LysR family transcriptional regulator, transcription activator of glutamate synthase operon